MAFMHIVFKGGSGLQRGANWYSFWYQDTGSGEPSDGDDMITTINGRLVTHMVAFLGGGYNLARADYTFYPGLNQAPYPSQVSNFTNISGLDTSPNLPSRMTMLVEFKAYANSGPVRKRVYLGCYGEDMNTTNGTPESDLTVALGSWADSMLGGVSVVGHDWNPVVCRVDPETGYITASNYLNSRLVQTKWAYLRSRDAGIGI